MNAGRELPKCVCRHDWDTATGTFFCGHPKVRSSSHLVTSEHCLLCNRWQEPPPEKQRPYPTLAGTRRDGLCAYLGPQEGTRNCLSCRGNVQQKVYACIHPAHEQSTVQECHKCADYELPLGKGNIKSWAVGVTTAPRRSETLSRTLDKLCSAGFDEVRIFAEPESPLPPLCKSVSLTLHDQRLGAWPNWYLALSELYMRSPTADAYMLVQDDVTFCTGIREYLEHALWPNKRIGFVSIYRSAGYGKTNLGFTEVDLSPGMLGALSLIIPNFAARSLLSHRETLAHRLRGRNAGLAQIDDVVGHWARMTGLGGWIHTPSLSQHIGEESAIWSTNDNSGKRRASDYVGDEFDATTLIASTR